MRWLLTLGFMCSLFMLANCDQLPSASGVNDTVYDRVLETNEIRVGYISYSPSFIVDANSGAFSGISHDILQKAAANLGLELEFVEEVAWGSMIEAIQSNRIDMVATGIWPSAARGKRASFLRPIFYSPVSAYVRSEDRRFDGNLARVNAQEINIATIDGELAETIAMADFPEATIVSLPQLSQVSELLLSIDAGKADITFVEPAVAEAYLEKNPGSLRRVADVEPVRAFPTAYLVSKDAIKFSSMMNIAISELIRNGEVDEIVSSYERYPGSFITVPKM